MFSFQSYIPTNLVRPLPPEGLTYTDYIITTPSISHGFPFCCNAHCRYTPDIGLRLQAFLSYITFIPVWLLQPRLVNPAFAPRAMAASSPRSNAPKPDPSAHGVSRAVSNVATHPRAVQANPKQTLVTATMGILTPKLTTYLAWETTKP